MMKLLAQRTVLRVRLLLLLCKYHLGKDFTPQDYTPDVVACAEAVTTILKQAGMADRVITGTYTLYEYFARSKYYAPARFPKPGDIVISPTGMSPRSPIRGHVGIVGENGLIYSNDSFTGKWATHYTIDTWKARYKDYGGYPVLYFRYISVL